MLRNSGELLILGHEASIRDGPPITEVVNEEEFLLSFLLDCIVGGLKITLSETYFLGIKDFITGILDMSEKGAPYSSKGRIKRKS